MALTLSATRVICLYFTTFSTVYNLAKDTSGAIVEAFPSTLEYIQSEFVPKVKQSLAQRNTFTLIQFSGVSQKEGSYVPGSNGDAGAGLQHYKVEVPTQTLDRPIKDFTNAERKYHFTIGRESGNKCEFIFRAGRKWPAFPVCPRLVPIWLH